MEPQLLQDWMGTQRWFAGKGRQWHVAGVEQLAELRGGPAPVRLLVVRADYDDGSTEAYQLAVSMRPEPNDALGHVLIGEVDEDGTRYFVYDGFHDKEATALLLRGLKEGGTVGGVEFHPLSGGEGVPETASSNVLSGEQSNTSLVFGGTAIYKAFRKLAPGLNPDIEIHEALLEVGAEEIARPLAHVTGRWEQAPGEVVEGNLGMMQEFLSGASLGWDAAQVSVRDLFAEGDLHADEVGGDFASESFRLGEATARVHLALAEALGTTTLSGDALRTLATAMQHRLEAAAADVPALEAHVESLSKKYDALAERDEPVVVQRIHGDYHLGQVMRTAYGWKLLDFEGEPAKPLAERRLPDSVIRDVAGMLRSFDYAARFQLMDRARDGQLEYRADEWAERNRSAFCDGYAAAGGRDPRDDGDLICAYEADKAVYELIYEARNRPGWVRIPLGAIERLSEAEHA
ncbi:maltokinase [Motilibacter peucedani]|uniref:Maltokinase n=1 Tax=Motilibacter peucedani TaxID=598650 RepID=A0A420XLC6_9ACTN|nr:hypothetical protein [Motilibacter peucedani]RKS71317.1 maltokinase [Motilibacter peucedani]